MYGFNGRSDNMVSLFTHTNVHTTQYSVFTPGEENELIGNFLRKYISHLI